MVTKEADTTTDKTISVQEEVDAEATVVAVALTGTGATAGEVEVPLDTSRTMVATVIRESTMEAEVNLLVSFVFILD